MDSIEPIISLKVLFYTLLNLLTSENLINLVDFLMAGSLHLMALAPVGSKPTSVVMGPNSSEIKPITGTKLRNKNMASTKETKYVVDKIVCLFDSRNKPESDLLRNSSHSSVEVSGTHSMVKIGLKLAVTDYKF